MKILVGGDFVISNNYNVNNLSNEIVDLYKESDINIVNLEAPITDTNSKIFKSGPHLKSYYNSTLEILKTLNIHTVTLANNHLLDYGEKGISDTLNFCKENNINYVGAGMNLNQAVKTLYLDSKEGKIGIVNFAENEWASATETSAGSNPLDIISNISQIKEAKEKANYVIVIIHGGHEYYNLPSPRMQKLYRFYAQQGADFVIGHHTHCINGFEIYKKVPIYYSLGNFLFTRKSLYEGWYQGLILQIDIEHNKISSKLLPIGFDKDSYSLGLLNDERKNNVNERIKEYNEIIKDSKKLQLAWDEFVLKKYNNYLYYWGPKIFIKNKYIRGVFNKLNINMLNRTAIGLRLNLLRCESHLDLSINILKKYLYK